MGRFLVVRDVLYRYVLLHVKGNIPTSGADKGAHDSSEGFERYRLFSVVTLTPLINVTSGPSRSFHLLHSPRRDDLREKLTFRRSPIRCRLSHRLEIRGSFL